MIFPFLISYHLNPAASHSAWLVRAMERAIGCHKYLNATATTNCCFILSWVYHHHPVVCWMTPSVALVTPWAHTGTGRFLRYGDFCYSSF